MASQGSTVSRLAQMQMRFQQKQQQEREKKLEQIKPLGNHETGGGGGGGDSGGKLSATFGPGKVRQMFDERRQRGTGIDKSYPLQPITQKSPKATSTTNTSSNSSTTIKTSSVTSVRRTVGVKQSNGLINNHIDMTTANRINGNVGLLNKLDGNYYLDDNSSLDDEQFPDSQMNFDDELLNNSISTKLPNVGKLNLTSINNNNNNNNTISNHNTNKPMNGSAVKLKPVVLKKSNSGEPPKPSMGIRKAPLNKTAPSSIRTSQESSPEKILSSPRSKSGSKAPITTGRAASKPESKSAEARTMAATTTKSVAKVASTPPPGMAACKNCGRVFNEDRIEKHQSICSTTGKKKRKPFDITKHRVKGTEAEQYVKKATKTGKTTSKKEEPSGSAKKSDWRRKHEEFIQAIRAAKEVQAHLARGGKISDLPPPPPSENPDYIQCPHCNRRFNEAAATRHIPKCATMLHNKPKPAPAKKRF